MNQLKHFFLYSAISVGALLLGSATQAGHYIFRDTNENTAGYRVVLSSNNKSATVYKREPRGLEHKVDAVLDCNGELNRPGDRLKCKNGESAYCLTVAWSSILGVFAYLDRNGEQVSQFRNLDIAYSQRD